MNGLTKPQRTAVLDRLSRVRQGNFGDIKPIQGVKGLFELRFHIQQGFRAYYGRDGNTIVVLLTGADKGDQDKAIKQAEILWNEYLTRKKNATGH